MADQAAPPEATPEGHAPGQGVETDALHKDALGAEKHLESLATGLAHAGADKSVTDAVGKMAESMRKIVEAMGKSQPPPAAEDTPPAQPAPRETMNSAADGMVNDIRAARGH